MASVPGPRGIHGSFWGQPSPRGRRGGAHGRHPRRPNRRGKIGFFLAPPLAFVPSTAAAALGYKAALDALPQALSPTPSPSCLTKLAGRSLAKNTQPLARPGGSVERERLPAGHWDDAARLLSL